MRVGGEGLIERGRRIPFRFDGRVLQGVAGDTLASALLANGVRVVGRSFKYHRPRGVLTAGSEEPNALVTLGRGRAQAPNRRATTVELVEGLEARSQNRWPSRGFDLMAVNDWVAPWLGAGFYYKTFMWPPAFWERVYEPLIRRAAGLGALSGEADDGICEKAWAHCDLLVIGAGPAGLMAALVAARAGADVILAEQDTRLGGRLNAESIEVDGVAGRIWAGEIARALAGMENVRVMTRTAVTGAYDGGTYAARERLAPEVAARAGAPRACFWRIVARRAVLAAGAIERPIAFRNNDRPGIMMAGAVRAYVNRWCVSPGRSVAVFANHDDAHRTVADLIEAGVHVSALIDARHDAQCALDVPFHAGAQVVDAHGRQGLEAITVATQSGTERIQAEALAVSGGWNPAVHLSCHLGGRPRWNADIAAFVPGEGAVPGMRPAGACNGAFTTRACLREGAAAARAQLGEIGLTAPRIDLPGAEDGAYDISPLWTVPGRGRAWLDFQNDVTVKDVRQAATENFRAAEHMKRYTTLGMATDQGKLGAVNALAVLAEATGREIAETGTTTFRPPYVPVGIAAMGAGGRGAGFAPERFAPSHDESLARGAPMIEAGLWHRASHFPAPGEYNWRQACDREVGQVRRSVGVCDVSTLGKIEIRGRDAARFLDFVYANRMSTLSPGRVRYGVMLREDGHVMDDGTCARLGEDHFLVTTTTGAAGEVMRHLEFVHQCLRPEWDLQMLSVTEQWAQVAVAGPGSRELLEGVLVAPLAPARWPFMACGEVQIASTPEPVAGRCFRISFSGELGFEIAVPARYGAALFRELVARAEAMGGGPYGMEALNVLRIEKGFLTHAEIDGRTTAFDLGFVGVMAREDDFIGKAAAGRPGLCDPGREQLVGLRPVGEVRMLIAGAHLFEPGSAAVSENAQGHVTSAAFSPTLGHFLGLALLRNGRARHGERVQMVDHLKGVTALCEVQDPVQYDPGGERCRD